MAQQSEQLVNSQKVGGLTLDLLLGFVKGISYSHNVREPFVVRAWLRNHIRIDSQLRLNILVIFNDKYAHETHDNSD